MTEFRAVSPFSNSLPRDLFEGFVGRDREITALDRAFAGGARGVLIVGPAGAGKTSLARVFANRFERQFSGGVTFASASWVESAQHLVDRLMPATLTGTALLILDDAEVFEDVELHHLSDAVVRHPMLRLIVTARRRLSISEEFPTIELGGLSREEFQELLHLRHALAHGQPDEDLVDRLFKVAGGNALFAKLATTAVRDGVVASWQQLFEYIRGFRTPGVVGPDGRALSTTSSEYQQIIVDVSSTNASVLEVLKRNPELARSLPSRRFEEIVAELLIKQGYDIVLTPPSSDGGFDIYAARKERLGKFLYLVECKRYVPPNKVGVEIVRSLYGVVQTKRATAGAIVTTSFFTAGAEEFRREVQHQLHFHDYIALQKWITDFPTEREAT